MKNATVQRRLRDLPGWKAEGGFLVREYKFEDFMQGIAFVNRLARLAERHQHHPDIHVRYTTVRIELQTHDEGGITARDFKLAAALKRIEKPRRIRKH